ncbi:MAG: hypothetical protein K5857_10985 [Lachnospiraceae bacterium]|nr:hypothetical protein [Lachnospiraceae bacterium]
MKRKNKAAVFVFIVIVLILVLIQCVISYRNYFANYHGFMLKNASCSIPIRMWNPEEDEIYISDHMFSVTDKEKEYLILGVQLENIESEDESQVPFPIVFDPGFLKYSSLYSLENLVKNNSDVLQDVTAHGEYERPSFYQYYICGKAKNDYSDYETYIVTLNQEEIRFIGIIMYKDSVALTEKEKKYIFENCNYKSSIKAGN